MKARGWLLALAINALVSATVTWAVLAWWQRAHPCPPVPTPVAVEGAAVPDGAATPTGPWFPYIVQPGDTWDALAAHFGLAAGELQAFNGQPTDAPLAPGQMLRVPGTPRPTPTVDPASLEITAVLGAGVLVDERVQVRNQGAQAVNLAGWTLEDEDGQRFVFPEVVLYPQGVLQVWTKAGTATVQDLFWGLTEAVWRSGETATLRAPDGSIVVRYQVP